MSRENEQSDPALIKYYKCHPNIKVEAVVCILCENVFYTGEFVAKYNTGSPVKLISNTLVICQDHANVALTSKLNYGSLNQEARELIAQIKLTNKEEIKQEILSKINLEKDKGHNTTFYEDFNELQSLKIENELLKQLNNELQEKNKLLNELLTKEKQGNNNIKPKTFSEIITTTKPKNKRIPKLVIKKTNNKDTTDLESTVQNYLIKDKNIQTKNITCKNNDTVIINCMNEKSINIIEKTLQEKLSKNFKIEKEQIANPKLKVIDIDMAYGNDKVIEQDINQRNFSNMENKCKVLHVFTNKRTEKNCAIIEVTSDIYKHIKENKSRLFIGYQSCRVFDLVNTNPCKKCARYGHSSSKCKNKATCVKCSGDHLLTQCTNTINKCSNCIYSNEKFKTKHNINHCAIDSELCEILKTKIKKYIEMTDYPMQPIYPRFFGSSERPQILRKVRRTSRISSIDSTGTQQPLISGTSRTTTTGHHG